MLDGGLGSHPEPQIERVLSGSPEALLNNSAPSCVCSEDVSQNPLKRLKLPRLKIGVISKRLLNKRQRKRMRSGYTARLVST